MCASTGGSGGSEGGEGGEGMHQGDNHPSLIPRTCCDMGMRLDFTLG